MSHSPKTGPTTGSVPPQPQQSMEDGASHPSASPARTASGVAIDRRAALGRLGTVAAGGALAACGGPGTDAPAVQARPRVRWNLVSSFPAALDTIFGAAEVFATKLAELTDGRFTVRVNQAGELVPGLQVLDAVQQGSAQAGHTASYYYTGKHPALAFDTAMPFGLDSRQQTAWLVEGGGLELLRGVFADFNIINFPSGNTGVQMGGWFRREVPTLADLRGLKMRIPGLGAQVLSELGVTVQTLSGGEIYTALERGAIDATEWVGPYDDEKLGFHEIADFYYYPGWWEPGPSLSLYVNRGAWDSLTAEYKAAVEAASSHAHLTMQARYDALNPPALERLLAKGVQLRPFSADVMQAAHDIAFELMEQNAAAEASYRRILESWKPFRKTSLAWFGTAELAMAQFRR